MPDQRKNILLVFRDLPPPFLGGARVYVFELYSRLRSLSLTVSTSRKSVPGEAEVLEGARVIRHGFLRPLVDTDLDRWPWPMRILRRTGTLLLWNLRLFFIGLRSRPDVIVMGRADYCFPAVLALRRLTRAPLVLHLYGEDWTLLSEQGTRTWRVLEVIFKRWMKQADVFIYLTDQLRRQVEAGGFRTEGLVIPPGVDTDRFVPVDDRQALRERYAPGADRLVLCCSRLVERKGNDTAIRAFAAVRDRHPGARMVVAGVGEEDQALHRLAEELGLGETVRFTGEVTEEEKLELFQAADVYLMPNRRTAEGDSEGFGIVYLEAGACGVPVISGIDGGVTEAVVDGENGFAVDAASPEPVARALDRLLADPKLCAERGARGRERAVELFSWPALVALLEARLSALAGGDRPGTAAG